MTRICYIVVVPMRHHEPVGPMRKLLLLLSGLLFGVAGSGRNAIAQDQRSAAEPASFDRGGFNDETILDWRVKVSADFARVHPAATREALALLHKELEAITHAVPQQRLPQLRRAVFWLDERVHIGAMSAKAPVFHPSAQWLLEHGLNPAMAGGIELPNAQVFLDSYSWEPWAIMHELAHFYHLTILGEHYTPIHDAYGHALTEHLYENVPHYDGKLVRAYALENEKEYFAELTEAYFGRNDYYPFTRDELETYDHAGFTLMQTVWGAP